MTIDKYIPELDFRHGGDRVFYEGREWRVHYVNWRMKLADLITEDGSGDFVVSVNLDHLKMAWCPKSHGGTGKPDHVDASLVEVGLSGCRYGCKVYRDKHGAQTILHNATYGCSTRNAAPM